MSSLPEYYASPLHLPFNRTCLDEPFALRGPCQGSAAPGYGVLLHGDKMLAVKEHGRLILPYGEWPHDSSLFIGYWQDKPCYLVHVTGDKKIPANLEMYGLLDENPELPIELLSVGGMGRMILHWQDRSKFCGYCGQPTKWLGGEWGRLCGSCGKHAFPAIHPCAIVLVTRPGEVLLTRKSGWASGRYSLVAGFQEFGESLEETAIREVAEETGVIVNNVRYVGSQCWPFPSQVMVGFVADYLGGDVQVDTTELADARWFATDDLPNLPPKRSIARYILDTFLGPS